MRIPQPRGTLVVLVLLAAVGACTALSRESLPLGGQSRGSLRLLLQHGSSSAHDFSGLPLPYILESPTAPDRLAELMGLSTEELFTLNAFAKTRSTAAQLPAGLAVQALGQPAVPPLPTTLTAETAQHVIAFCAAYDITLEAMQQANPTVTINQLPARTTLVVPARAGYEATCPPTAAACVQPGETLALLAQRLGCEQAALVAANPQFGPKHQDGVLYAGQAVRACTEQPASLAQHRIPMQPADSLYEQLLAVAGAPVTVEYLTKLAAANEVLSAEDLVRLLPFDYEVQLVDPEASLESLQAQEEEEVLDAPALVARRRLLAAPSHGSNPARLPFAFGRQLLQTYQPAGRRLEERAAPLLSRLHLPKGMQVIAGLRAAADDSLESAVAEGDAEGVLSALQSDVAEQPAEVSQQQEEEDDEVVSVVDGEQAASQRRGMLARRLLSEDGAKQPEALLASLTPRGRRIL